MVIINLFQNMYERFGTSIIHLYIITSSRLPKTKHRVEETSLEGGGSRAAKNEITTIYLKDKEKEKWKYNKKGIKLSNEWLNSKIAEISNKRGAPMDISISPSTIQTCLDRSTTHSFHLLSFHWKYKNKTSLSQT